MLDETDHPMAKMFLAAIREDAGVDEEEQAREMIKNLSGWLQENAIGVKGVSGKAARSAFESEGDYGSNGETMDNPLANKRGSVDMDGTNAV